jgi:Tc toxin complex TcA C-terminal TcB-binding domain/Neuraminidase-like domain
MMSPDDLEELQLAEALDADRYLAELSGADADLLADPADLEEELPVALLETNPDAIPAGGEASLPGVAPPLAPAENAGTLPPDSVASEDPEPETPIGIAGTTADSTDGTTIKLARIARLPVDAAYRLAEAAPDVELLSDDLVDGLVSEGVMAEPDARRLGLANVALELAAGEEAAADTMLRAMESRGAGTPQDLVTLTAGEISSVIEDAGVGTPEAARQQAEALKATVSNAFPTETLMGASVPAAPLADLLFPGSSEMALPPDQQLDAMKRASNRNPGVDLLRLDLSRHSPDRESLDLSDLSQPEQKAFLRDVQLRKDTLAVAGSTSLAEKFLSAGLGSPIKLASLNVDSLAQAAGLSPKRAETVRNRALHTVGRSANGLLTLWDALSGGLADLAVGNIRRAEVREFFDGLDNLQELFGEQDACQCKHCNSVLGPAAYFVDLMHFIQTHVLEERFKGLDTHPLHLRIRRPDLWTLPLTCENTHTEIPQLKITAEIFENFIAGKRGVTVDADRAGVTAAVYGSFLPSGRHSLRQPFQLPLEELEIYLSHFNLRRSDIMRLLDEPQEAQVRSEIGLSAIQAALTTNPDPSAENIHDKFGITLPSDGVLPMRELVNATGLSRDLLGEALETNFVAAGQPLLLLSEKQSAESVQADIERIRGLTLDHLDRLHRFLRLGTRLPWSPTELDAVLAASPGTLDSRGLEDVADALRLQRRFKARIEELCALAGDLPEFPLRRGATDTPIGQLFNPPDLVREDDLYPNPAIRFELSAGSEAATERSMRLRSALRLDEEELSDLVQGLSEAFEEGTGENAPAVLSRLFSRRFRNESPFTLPRGALLAGPVTTPALPVTGQPSFPLTRHNLSLLYRHAVLARWLKLDIKDFLALVRLTPGIGNHLTGLPDTMAVVQFYDWWKRTPFSIEDLSMLLAPPEAVTEQVSGLWQAIQAWLEEDGELTLTDTFLAQIDGVSEELSRQLITANLEDVFEKVGDGYRVLASWRDDAELDLGAAAPSTVPVEPIRALILSYHPDGRLPRALTEALRIEIGLARAIVDAALQGENELTSSSFLRPGPLPDELRSPMDALLRLHRIGSVLRLAPSTLQFFARHQPAFGISSWSEPNQGALRRIAALQAVIHQRFREDPELALAEVGRCIADTQALPDSAAFLFGRELTLLRDLAGTLRLPDNPIDRLFRLEAYADTAAKLSADAAALSAMTSDEFGKATSAAAAVLAGFRAKYPDEATWRDTVEPFEERVLEKKRDALIDHLLHGQDAVFPDATEMYKYFLIDGEVDGCFRTSKVVAATSSLQLYVHRIRMNLEKEPAGGLRVDPELIPDEEWEWRQHYRVWEANRKTYLWPENLLNPTTRDDKTPLFEDLESELLQQEITDQTVVDAYANYLKGLEELSNLRYAGAYHHYLDAAGVGEATDIIYLFGATGGDVPTHYWREIRNLARSREDPLVSPQYGPWEKVDVRIPARHVTPVVYDGQLHVFWNEISTTSQSAVDDGKSRFIGYSHRYSLQFTSLRLDGQWTPPERISLTGSAPVFWESDSSIDDPLVEKDDWDKFQKYFFAAFVPWFGIYRDPTLTIDQATQKLDEVKRRMLTPRYGSDTHSKAQEGYTLKGFMWERPYLSPDPAYGDQLLVNCAGFHVRGAVDLFDRRVLRAGDASHWQSPETKSQLLAYRTASSAIPPLLHRNGPSLHQASWASAPFDYPVAAALALNANDLSVFKLHWGSDPGWSLSPGKVADVPWDAGVWAVTGTPGEVVIETDDDLLLLQPDSSANGRYLLHRMGTSLVRDVAGKLFKDGVDGLLSIEHQLGLSEPKPRVSGPQTTDLTGRTQNPIANESPYGAYYQEIFQHIPLLIAHHLNAQGRFADAQRWYHYVFDPTSGEPPTGSGAPPTDRNWKYRQFRGQERQKLRSVLSDTAAIQKYRQDPFNAHAIARLRVSAYQKSVVMRYIDNLLDWADEEFTRFQMESVNEAMLLYLTAAEILGPRPALIGGCGELTDTTRTYDKLKGAIAKDGAFLLEVEELISVPSTTPPPTPSPGKEGAAKPAYGLGALLATSLSGAKATAMGGTLPMTLMMASMPGETSAAAVSGDAPAASKGVTGFVAAPASEGVAGIAKAAGTFEIGAAKTASGPPSGVAPMGAPALGWPMLGAPTWPGLGSGVLSTGWQPFVKVALPQPLTSVLVQDFVGRQEFAFLGGRWKANGGRVVNPTLGDRFGRAVVRQVSAAFCIPRNELLDDYWNRVGDRIQKIRTCRDITGRKRKLSLFAPPISPELLQRARALGIPLEDALGAFEGVIPQYRFPYLLEKAKAFTANVQAFGGSLQAALERKDSEELTLLQATQQQQILALTTKAKQWEFDSAQANLEATEHRRTAMENRRAHYAGLIATGLTEWEVAQTVATHITSVIKGGSAIMAFISGGLGLIPQVGSPFAMKYGGAELSKLPDKVAFGLQMLAEVAGAVATSAALEAGWDRRAEDWTFQRDQAVDELSQIEKQIEAAQIARDLAQHAIELHEKSIEHNEEFLAYHAERFSALGLYTWLASELQRTYREAYNMAYRMARYAEQAYRFEREDQETELLSGQYWEASRAGLLAGNALALDLQHMEQRYIETDQPRRELVNHNFSLRQWNPMALIELRRKGQCTFRVPELFFDLSSPGDYRRRIRSIRLTIPAVAGSFTNVMATLALDASWIRPAPTHDPQPAPRPRVDSITTSSARNDAGAFEVNFRGEKYGPFENAGAESEWTLSLPSAVRTFDYDTISDVVLHFDYTASFDGVFRDVVQGVTTGLVASLQDRLTSDGMVRAFSLREEFPEIFLRLAAGDTAELEVTGQHLPFFLQEAEISEASLHLGWPDRDSVETVTVELDGKSLGSTTIDERTDGARLTLPAEGATAWKHELRLLGLSARPSDIYLVLRLQRSEA